MNQLLEWKRNDYPVARTLGWAGFAVSVAALGLVVGREIRIRYKFSHRTPYDFYRHAGDRAPVGEYAMGV